MQFLGIGIYSDVKCASGVLLAHFAPRMLTRANATESPTEPEALVFGVPRDHEAVAHIIEGRVARVMFSDGAYDREWDIVVLSDDSDTRELLVTCQSVALRLGRVIYMGANEATHDPEPRFTGAATTAAEWVNELVLPACTAQGLTWVAAGTFDATNRFALEGEWASALEIVRALCVPGRANGEWRLRRNGDTSYLIDVLDSIGSDAADFTLHTRINLLATKRDRSLLDVATRLVPQLAGAEASWRTLAHHLFRIASVVNGTTLVLESWDGSTGPVGFDDQLNGLYLAVLNSHTFASQVVTDSVASTQHVMVASTTGMAVGNLVRFFVGSGASGARVTSLAHPTLAVSPASGGYGDRAMILPLGELVGACNYVPNAWQRDWATPADPPDDWTEFASTPANVAFAQATLDTLYADLPCFRMTVNTGFTASAVGTRPNVPVCIESPDIQVWALADGRYVATAWVNVLAAPGATDAVLNVQLMQGNTLVSAMGSWSAGDSEAETDLWTRYISAPLNLSGITGALRIRVELRDSGNDVDAGWDVLVGPLLVADSFTGTAPDDLEGAPSTAAWQAVNRRLAVTSQPIRGYDVRVADLARDDADVFEAYRLTPGAQGTLVDTDLGETVAQRVLEYRPDYLNALDSGVRLGAPFDTLSAWQDELLALAPRTPDPGVASAPEPAWLDIRSVVNSTTVTIYWDGAPSVLVSINGAAYGVPSASPIVVSRSTSTGAAKTYAFRAIGEDGVPVSQTIYVPKQDASPSADPAFTSGSCTGGFTPGDGGGEAEITFATENAPVGWTVDIDITNVTCDSGLFDTSESDTGVTASPHTVNIRLGPGAEFDVLLTLRNSGGTELDTLFFHVSSVPGA